MRGGRSRRGVSVAVAAWSSAVAIAMGLLVVGPAATTSAAAELESDVASEEQFRDALAACEALTLSTQSCEIRITSSFTITEAQGDPLYTGAAKLIIAGASPDVTVTGGGDVRFLRLSGDMVVELRDLSLTGFRRTDGAGGAVVSGDGLIGMTLFRVAMTDNAADGRGGAVRLDGGALSLFQTVFARNGALADGAVVTEHGGAVWVSGSGIVAEGNSLFVDNRALGRGGAVYVDGPVVDFLSNTFARNSAADGGALYAVDGSAYGVLGAVTFADNRASGQGGAVYMDGARMWWAQSTLVGNAAASGLGNAVFVTEDASRLRIGTTVFSRNGQDDACAIANGAELLTRGYIWTDDASCIGDPEAGAEERENFIVPGGDPRLGPLQDNGGELLPTWPQLTMMPAVDSPLRNAFTVPSAWTPGVARDPRGVNFLSQGHTIGAVHAPYPATTFVVLDDEGHEAASFTALDVTEVSDVQWWPLTDVSPAPPPGIVGPVGVMGFTAEVLGPGAWATFTATLPQPVNQVWKLVGGAWVQVTDAEISGTTVTFRVQDGGPLDADGQRDGTIVDPVLFAVGARFTG